MIGNRHFLRQIYFQAAILFIAVAGITGLAACNTAPVIEPTRTMIPTFTPPPSATATPSPSRTPTPTTTRTTVPTQTLTPGPSRTSTATEEPIASLTPAVPLIESSRYDLVNWSFLDASRLVELLEAYPDANFKNKESASYFEAYRFALYAEQEGILRYPDSLAARLWRWDAAYNMARTGDDRAGSFYADLIQTALNADQVNPDHLNSWFFNIEPRMALRPVELEPIQGTLRTMLLVLEGRGSAFQILVEVAEGFQIYPVATFFNFADPQEYDFTIADLTGDGNGELVLYQVSASIDAEPGFPLVFSMEIPLSQPLPFNPAETIEFNLNHRRVWTTEPNAFGYNDLVMETTIFPACPLDVTYRFRWNGLRFEYLSTSYRFEPDPALLRFCDAAVDHAAANWGAPATFEIADQLVTIATDLENTQFPAELVDKWNFQLGVSHGLLGNYAAATDQLEALRQNPKNPDGPWDLAADNFLAAYNSVEAIYTACTTTDFCSDREALAARLDLFTAADYDLVIDQLGRENLPIRASGFFDFEDDGTPERWFTFRHPGAIFLDLWILGLNSMDVFGLYVDQVDTAISEFEVIDNSGTPPGIRLFFQKNFVFSRLPDTDRPFLTPYDSPTIFTVDRVRETWEAARDALLTGADPARIRSELLALKSEDFFICPYATCKDFIFTLALSSELSGDSTLAIENYHRLWLDYPKIAFTIHARLKLIGEIFHPD